MVKRQLVGLTSVLLVLTPFGLAGNFAAKGVAIWDQLGTRTSLPSPLLSPDGHVSVKVHVKGDIENRRLVLSICRTGQCHDVSVPNGVGAELLWSPDSRRFALTWSDSGSLGGYSTMIVTVESDGDVSELPITKIVRRAFGHPVKCEVPEPPNVLPVQWISDDEILVAAQIVPHTICDSAGTFKAYEVDIHDRKIIKTLNQIETKQQYGSYLGAFLLSAKDICVTHPPKCELPQNHKRTSKVDETSTMATAH